MKTVILRNLNEDDAKAIEFLKKETGQSVASKAIVNGVHSYIRLYAMYQEKCQENRQLITDMEKIKKSPEIIDALSRLNNYSKNK